MSRSTEIRYRLELAERMSAEIAANKKLADIVDFQHDTLWKQFLAEAIDPSRHSQCFADVRFYLDCAASGHIDPDEAFQKADAKLREFDDKRRYLGEAIARWDANAPTRHAQMQRSTWQWQRALAEHLNQNVGGTKEEQWKDIPDDNEGRDGTSLVLDGVRAEVFRRGDEKLYCDDGKRLRKIAYASFFRHYLKAGQDKSR